MAEVTEVKPEGIQIYMKIPLKELTLLKKGLELTELHVDLSNPEHKEINEYITEDFYPFIKKIVEDLSDGT